MDTAYCISCEREVFCPNVLNVPSHLEDGNWCDGPFTTCPPPEIPEDWELYVEEPGSDELFLMNIHARQLLTELNS